MAAGNKVAELPASALVQVLGPTLEVRRSGKDGKKYPLYLVTPWGPWPINTAAGQDFLLENANFSGAETPASPEQIPEPAPVPEMPPAQETAGVSPEPEQPKKKGFWHFD